MTIKDHDTLAVRLAEILKQFNEGKNLDIGQLAEQFGVHQRTIQRDLHERFAFLPIKKVNGRYSLEEFYLNKLSTSDIYNFAAIAGVKGLFPQLNNEFLARLLDTTINDAYLVKGHHYEDSNVYQHLFAPLESAITQGRMVNFRYNYKVRNASPYRLLSSKGIWYLAAVENATLKSFKLSGIGALELSTDTFTPLPEIVNQVNEEDSIWFAKEKREVVLKIASNIAHYFERRQLIPDQKIDKRLEDGSLIVSTHIASENQILPIIRYWMPHIRVISPDELQHRLQEGLRSYLISDPNS